jgi:hypothetical protein
MKQTEIYQFVEQYLEIQECKIIAKDSSYITTELSVIADKDIANRPYYWMFHERTGTEHQPLELTFIFDEEKVNEIIKGETIKFGCWRLHQIFQSAKQHGQFVRLYEEVSTLPTKQGLVPWLLLNYKISFVSDQKKDIFYPIGFNLITGKVLTRFDEVLGEFELTPKIPDYHFTLSPIFSLESAISQIETHINHYLEGHDPGWAMEANERLNEEVELMRAFYTDPKDEEQLTLQNRIEEVENYRPKIEVNAINVGIIYLQTNPLSKIR